MLDKIKSLFILKKFFNHVSEKIKLNLLVHHKILQNKLNIKIIDYKRISERYIIYERKGKGKEYDCYNDKLIYDGEYLNRKRHGLGKEYNKEGYIIFEGEYLNGKYNGKGKEYYNNKLIFEGEFLNGKRNGKGIEYNNYGNLKYDGEYLNGKYNGKGKEYNKEGKIIYDGYYFYDHKYKGKIFNKGILIFEGEFLFDKKLSGKEYDENKNIIYELKNGSGKTREYFKSG